MTAYALYNHCTVTTVHGGWTGRQGGPPLPLSLPTVTAHCPCRARPRNLNSAPDHHRQTELLPASSLSRTRSSNTAHSLPVTYCVPFQPPSNNHNLETARPPDAHSTPSDLTAQTGFPASPSRTTLEPPPSSSTNPCRKDRQALAIEQRNTTTISSKGRDSHNE